MRKIAFFLIACCACLMSANVARARSLAGEYASEMMRYGRMSGYISGAGGATLNENTSRTAYSGAFGVVFPFFRLELEYLNIDKKDTPAEPTGNDKATYKLHGVFNNYYLGEFLYGGIGFGRGDWDGVTTDMIQYIGGVELPLGQNLSIGAEYRRIKSDAEGEITKNKFDAETVMAKIRIYF